MPINILRLNQRQHHPNDRIAFIKPLPHAESPENRERADLFLRRVAAICYPIMKAHSLSVTTLEEFPPNREFWGRNFNGGEVIQLVLRRMPQHYGPVASYGESARTTGLSATPAPLPQGITVTNGVGRIDQNSSGLVANDDMDSGGWLPMRTVMMVMMHELAHCIEMNHSRAFWAVRNDYAAHLRVLWQRGYTGEGMWGRGQGLSTGRYIEAAGNTGLGEIDLLCGGAFKGRGKGRKRGRGKQLGYAERKKLRLEKIEGKFGKGTSVGESETAKLALEGKFNAAKPRVANSKRGKDLRAAAALARFEKDKVDKSREMAATAAAGESGGDEDETASEGSATESEDEGETLKDEQGKPVRDAQGQDLYRVCDDANPQADEDARNELEELTALDEDVTCACDQTHARGDSSTDDPGDLDTIVSASATTSKGHGKSIRISSTKHDPPPLPSVRAPPPLPSAIASAASARAPTTTASPASSAPQTSPAVPAAPGTQICAICLLENPALRMTCEACSHVLDAASLAAGRAWRCGDADCNEAYLNDADCGACGICGRRKGV